MLILSPGSSVIVMRAPVSWLLLCRGFVVIFVKTKPKGAYGNRTFYWMKLNNVMKGKEAPKCRHNQKKEAVIRKCFVSLKNVGFDSTILIEMFHLVTKSFKPQNILWQLCQIIAHSYCFVFNSLNNMIPILFSGISGKSQILFALVFTSRYLDLFTSFISIYNTAMKLFFLTSSFFTVFLMFMKFRATYDSNHDTFRMEFLVVPVGGLAFLVNHEFSPLEVGVFCYWFQ